MLERTSPVSHSGNVNNGGPFIRTLRYSDSSVLLAF